MGGSAAAAGGTASTAGLGWGGTILTLSDLPRDAVKLVPPTGQHIFVADDVRGIRKHDAGLMQTRLAFAAYPDRVVTLELIRWVKQRFNGSYGPKGDWLLKDHQIHSAVGEVHVRKGTVAVGALITEDKSGDGTAVRREHESGVSTEVYLPPQVRRDLAQVVPTPGIHIGQITSDQYNQEIHLLRLDTRGAVVLTGKRRHDATADWKIIRRQYTFNPGRALTS